MGNWRQSFPFFMFQYIPLRLKNPEWANKRYIVQNQISYNFFWPLIDAHFENVPIQVAWCNTSHVCKAVKSVISRPESNNFALAVQPQPKFTSGKKIRFVPFWYRPPIETMKYEFEVRNKLGWTIETRRIACLYLEPQIIWNKNML